MSTANEIRAIIEQQIFSGELASNERLPSVRALAAQHGVAPGTAAAVYRQLAESGLIVAGRGRQGSRVAPRSATGHQGATRPLDPPPGVVDARHGSPDAALLPDVGDAVRRVSLDLTAGYGSVLVHPELLAAAKRRFESDQFDVRSMLVTNGSMDAVERALRSHGLRVGDKVGVEDPGHGPVHQVVRGAGLTPVPLLVDERGITIESTRAALASRLSAIIVTPRAQNPTGAAFDRERAEALSQLLGDHPDVVVIQDDYAGLVAGVPIAQIRPVTRSWITVHSVGKALGPDLRLALVFGDRTSIDRMSFAFSNGPGWVSHLLQRTVAELLVDPATDAVVAEANVMYSRRRGAMLDALRRRGIEAVGQSGFNVWVEVANEQAVVQRLLESGYAVAAGERWRIGSPPAVRISTSTLTPDEIEGLAEALSQAQNQPIEHSVSI